MRVMQGWSGETATNRWAKVDVTVEEEDLRRILHTAGLPVDQQLSTADAFKLLAGEAERLVLVKLMVSYGYPVTEAQQKIAAITATADRVLAHYRQATDAG